MRSYEFTFVLPPDLPNNGPNPRLSFSGGLNVMLIIRKCGVRQRLKRAPAVPMSMIKTGDAGWGGKTIVLGVLPCILLLSQLIAAAAPAAAFTAQGIDDPAVLSVAMSALARAVMAEYKNDDRRVYLDTLFRLQMAAGD